MLLRVRKALAPGRAATCSAHRSASLAELLCGAALLSSFACLGGSNTGTADIDAARAALHFSAVTVADGQLFAAGGYTATSSSGQPFPAGIFSTPIEVDGAGVPRPTSVSSMGSGREFFQSLIVGLGSRWLVANKALTATEVRVSLGSLDGSEVLWERAHDIESLELVKLSDSAFAIEVSSGEPTSKYTEIYRLLEGHPEWLMTIPRHCVGLALAERYAYCVGDPCDVSSCDSLPPPVVVVYDTPGDEITRVAAPAEFAGAFESAPWKVDDVLFVPVNGLWLAYDVTSEEPTLTAMGVLPATVANAAQLPLRDGLFFVQGNDGVGLLAVATAPAPMLELVAEHAIPSVASRVLFGEDRVALTTVGSRLEVLALDAAQPSISPVGFFERVHDIGGKLVETTSQ